MSTGTAVAIPQGLQLPAHLATPEAAAQIAAANAAAAGGIKTGGSFPKISIKANKFHEIDPAIDSGAPRTYMVAAAPGQPPLPMMCLEAVVLAANPGLTKTYYEGDYVEGGAEAPNCQSTDGITPDAHVAKKESPVCATCPKNQWGSRVSKLSGKDIKACDDSKQLAILPGADLTYKALGLSIGKGSLKNWGKYVAALSERSYPVAGIVTNVMFDNTATGVLTFSFNRFLTPAEYAQVQERATGADVREIVNPVRTIALPAPTAQAALPAPVPAPAPAPFIPPAPPAPAPAPLQAATGFGATAPVAAAPAAPAAPEAAPKRVRRTREQIAADEAAKNPPAAVDLSYLPEAIQAAVKLVGAGSPAGIAMLAQFPKPVAPQPAAAQAQEAQRAEPPVVAAPATGFGATAAAPAAPAVPAAGASAAASSLKDALMAKLGLNKPAGQ